MLDDILAERNATHGNFAANAQLSQELKRLLCKCTALTDVQREALEAIAVKLSRILSGDPNHADHWDDIAGYATLVANEIRKKNGRCHQ
jgi:hypothetical protein